MIKWITCLAAIVAAYLLNYYLETPIPINKYLLIIAATGIVFVWSAPAPKTKLMIGKILSLSGGTVRTKNLLTSVGWTTVMMLCAMIAGGTSAWLFLQDLSNTIAPILWLGSIGLLLLAWWWRLAQKLESESDSDDLATTATHISQQPGMEWLLLTTILIVAFTVRIWRLDLFPIGMQSDEGGNARDALHWLAGAPYAPYAETNMGQATLFTYMIAGLFQIFGVSLETMRLTSVLVGTATVAAFYPLARKLFSVPVALFATALFAVDRWHMTFSRIVYELILTPLALLLTYYFVYLAITERRGRYWILAGLSVAFGLNTYTAFRISVIGVPLLILFWLLRDYRNLWTNMKWLGLCGLSAVVGLIPLIVYTIQHPDIVLLRTKQVFIGTEIAQAGSYAPLWFNIRRYLEMFTIHGDPSGLNNLPNEPLLGMVVGVLALLGLCYALFHWWKIEMFMLLVWIIGVLPAGMLSVTLETPSARRVIGLVPLVYLLVAVVAEVFWRLSVLNLSRIGSVIWRLAAILVVGYIGYSNLQTFYSVQFRNQAVSEAFNPVESSVGQYLRGLDANATAVYLDAAFHDNAVVDFLSENFPHTRFSLIAHLPLHDVPDAKDVLFVFSPNSDALKPLLSSFYPEGQWKSHQNQFGTTVFQTFAISHQQLAQTQGVEASYYSDPSRNQAARIVQRHLQVGALPSPLPAPYNVDWGGTIYMPVHGVYTFSIATSTPITLTIDNSLLLTAGQGSPVSQTRTLSVAHAFAAGFHDIQLQTDVVSYVSSLPKLFWEGPLQKFVEVPATALLPNRLPPIGLIGSYYDNSNWEGAPFMVRRDLAIIADEGIDRDYSVIWRGQLKAPKDGRYLFGTTSDDGSLVYLDGELLIDNNVAGGMNRIEVVTELSSGLHDLEIRYFQSGGSRFMLFNWQPPEMPWQTVTGESLFSESIDQTALVEAAQPAQLVVVEPQPTVAVGTPGTSTLEAQVVYRNLHSPAGIATGKDHRVYVVESGSRQLLILSEQGELLRIVNPTEQPFSEPYDLAVGQSGELYVQDGGLGKVIKFDSEGEYLASIPQNPQFERARGIDVDADEQVWIAQTAAGQVMSMKPPYASADTLPRPIFDNFQPVDVLAHPNGTIWITDDGEHMLYILSKQGKQLFSTPIPAAYTVPGSHLALDANQFVYMTQAEQNKIVKYDMTGTEVEEFDLRSADMIKPAGIAIDAQQRIWLSDSERGTVTVITLPVSSTSQPISPISAP